MRVAENQAKWELDRWWYYELSIYININNANVKQRSQMFVIGWWPKYITLVKMSLAPTNWACVMGYGRGDIDSLLMIRINMPFKTISDYF
jgi:hypothetical protein